MREIENAIEIIKNDHSIMVVIITGVGDKAFCSGADIHWMESWDDVSYSKRGQEVMNKIEDLPKPVIAAINGYCIGGGMEIACSSDIRIASENSRFGLPEGRLGIIPAWGGTQRPAKIMGPSKTKEMLLIGELMDAGEAERVGLVSKVVPQEVLMESAIDIAHKIAKNAPLSLKASKETVNKTMKTGLEEGLNFESEAMLECFLSEDKKEGFKAFFEKRDPMFKGK